MPRLDHPTSNTIRPRDRSSATHGPYLALPSLGASDQGMVEAQHIGPRVLILERSSRHAVDTTDRGLPIALFCRGLQCRSVALSRQRSAIRL